MKHNSRLFSKSVLLLVGGSVVLGIVLTITRAQVQTPTYPDSLNDMRITDTEPLILYDPTNRPGEPQNIRIVNSQWEDVFTASVSATALYLNPHEYVLHIVDQEKDKETTHQYIWMHDGKMKEIFPPNNQSLNNLVQSPDERYWLSVGYDPNQWIIYDTAADAWIDIDEDSVLTNKWSKEKNGSVQDGVVITAGWLHSDDHSAVIHLEYGPKKGGPKKQNTTHTVNVTDGRVTEQDNWSAQAINQPLEAATYRALCDNTNVLSIFYHRMDPCDIDLPTEWSFTINRESVGRNSISVRNSKTGEEQLVELGYNVARENTVAAEWLGDTGKLLIQEGPNISVYDTATQHHALAFTIPDYVEDGYFAPFTLMVLPQTK